MKIFFLEDNMNRYTKFFKWIETKCKWPNVLSASDADEAISILKENKKFDIIFLDHDLGGKVFVDSNEDNTGYRVAKFIKDNGIKYKQCIIHSQNPAGAINMERILDGSIRVPFPELIKS